jgi:hypothetical protein
MTQPEDRMDDSIGLSGAERRQIRRLRGRVDRSSDADRKFFERFPHRRYRVRLAGAAEIEPRRSSTAEPSSSGSTAITSRLFRTSNRVLA